MLTNLTAGSGMRSTLNRVFCLSLCLAAFSATDVWAGWYGPCGVDADCDDGNRCTEDSCTVATGSCNNPMVDESCCDTDADCFDGDPCTVAWCEGTPPASQCEYHPLYPGCCFPGNTEQCVPIVDSCFTGACTLDLYGEFGGCSSTPLCCSTDPQCHDGDDSTLDNCAQGLCDFEPSASWCGPNGICPISDKRVELLPGFETTHFIDCIGCLTRPLWEHCAIPGNCPVGQRCCEVDSDCRGELDGSEDWCDTTDPCTVSDQGPVVEDTSGTCVAGQSLGCKEPRDCVVATGGVPAVDCEDFSPTIPVPVCHSGTQYGVSQLHFCNESGVCEILDTLCTTHADCPVADGCISGVCGKLEGESVGKCVYLPTDWASLLPTQKSDIQTFCMNDVFCKKVTCGLDFTAGPNNDECPPGFDSDLACTSFKPGYSNCIATQLAGSAAECCTNDFDCDDSDPTTADRCFDGKCTFPVKLPCTSDDDCIASDCICLDPPECAELQCYGGCVLLMNCVDDGIIEGGDLDYCYPTIVADDGSACNAFFDECFVDGLCDAMGVCEMPEPPGWSCSPDGNECTIETVCDPETGCSTVNAVDGTPCHGMNPCEEFECLSGVCSAIGSNLPDKIPCDQYETCKTSVCELGQCVQKGLAALGTPCEPDGQPEPCRSYQCDGAGACVLHVNAPPSTPCAVPCGTGTCVDGACSVSAPEPDWTDCPEQTLCMRSACFGGKCEPVPEVVADDTLCPSADNCQEWRCQGGECRYYAGATNGQACTWERSCYQWSCLGGRCETIDEQSFGPQGCSMHAPEDSCLTWQCLDWVCLPDEDVCDDSDVCTEDLCISPGDLESCIFVDISGNCDDSNPCTSDTCDPVLGCQHTAVSGSCTDNNACTVGDYCLAGACAPGTPTDCDDSDPCTADSCNTVTGSCEYTTAGTDGISCDDGDACTIDDECASGVCGGSPLTCDDSNVCTDDSCDPPTGCVFVPNQDSCDAGNACFENDYCEAGTCEQGTYVDCGDTGNPCTTKECDSVTGCSGPVNLPADVPCSDALLGCELHSCDGSGACIDRGDVSDAAPCLPEGDPLPCKAFECQSGACVLAANAPDGIACSTECGDGQCQSGTCSISAPAPVDTPCASPNPCQAYACDGAGTCVDQLTPIADGSPCPSTNPCGEWECSAGVCLPVDVKAASSPCQWPGSCNEWECSSTGTCSVLAGPPIDPVALCGGAGSCVAWSCTAQGQCKQVEENCSDDGFSCTNDYCMADGATCAHVPLDASCDDLELCTSDSCDPAAPGSDPVTGCSITDNTLPCDDADACTAQDTCAGGACAGAPVDCDDLDPCTNDSCDPLTGCNYDFNTAPCEDGDLCTLADECDGAGNCIPGSAQECDDQDVCTVDSCDSVTGNCVFTPKDCSAYESDQNVCTVPICIASQGGCVDLGALDCDDLNQCTDHSCDPVTGCSSTPSTSPCEDGDPCTLGDTCNASACDAGVGVLDCDDGNPCTTNVCQATVGCVTTPLPDQTPCDDLDACTIGDECVTGVCSGALVDCDDSDVCTVDLCDPATGCVPEMERPAPPEVCDGADNDCDSLIDEEVLNPCGGCSALANPPGKSCAAGVGLYYCISENSTACESTPQFVGDGCAAQPEIAAVIHGKVLDVSTGQPIADAKIESAPRSYFQCTGHVATLNKTTDAGEFHVPVTDLGKHVFDFRKTGYITAQKEVFVTSANGTAGIIYMLAIDGQSTTIYAGSQDGQTAKSSLVYLGNAYIEVVVPPNTAIEREFSEGVWTPVANVDIQLTWYPTIESLPGKLPPTSQFTYAINLQPEGTRFSNPVNVRFLNVVPKPSGGTHGGFAAQSRIPVGLWKPEVGHWQQIFREENGEEIPVLAEVSSDSVWIEFPLEHFSSYDINLPTPPPPAAIDGDDDSNGDSNEDAMRDPGLFGDGDDNGGNEDEPAVPKDNPAKDDCGGSRIDRQNGALRLHAYLPGAVILGKQHDLKLVYDSSTAAPEVYLSSWYDHSNFSPPPARMKFRWSFEGQSETTYYQPGSTGVAGAGVLLPAANAAGESLATGLYPYFTEFSAQYWAPEYVMAMFFSMPAVPDMFDSGVPPIVEEWVSTARMDDSPVVDLSDGPFGSGWSIAGHMELHSAPFSGTKMVVVSGTPVLIRQARRITRFAGLLQVGSAVSTGDGGKKLKAQFNAPLHAARTTNGHVLVTEQNRIRKVNSSGAIVTLAGCGALIDCPASACRPDLGEDCTGFHAKNVYLDRPWDIEVASNGEIYFTDRDQNALFKIDTSKLIHRLVENAADCGSQVTVNSTCNPTGLALEETPDGVNVYYLSTVVGQQAHDRGVRRLRYDGIVQPVTEVDGSYELDNPQDILLLAPGQLVVSERNANKVHEVVFTEDESENIDPASTQVTVLAGNGTQLGLEEPIIEGIADQQPIANPTGLALGPTGELFVVLQGASSDSQIARIVPNGDGQGNWIIMHYAGGFSEELEDGADLGDVILHGGEGINWFDEGLVYVSGGRHTVWRIADAEQSSSGVFTYVREKGTGWELGQRGGMTHTFDSSGRHLTTVDRWGRTTTYAYDGGALETITWPGGYQWTLDYGGDSRVDSVQLKKFNGAAWVDVGQPATLAYEDGNLITFSSPDSTPMQHHYEGPLMTRRYASTARSGDPERFVEYEWKNNMVEKVLFHDNGDTWQNRRYEHSRELLLPEFSEAAGDYDDPIPQPASPGWDLTEDGEGREIRTHYDSRGDLLEAILQNGSRVEYVRDEDGRTVAIKRFETDVSTEPLEELLYTYTEAGRLKTASVGQSTWTYKYETKQLPPPDDQVDYEIWTGMVNPEGERTMFTYDEYGNRIETAQLMAWTEDEGVITPTHTNSFKTYYAEPASGKATYFCDADCMANDGVLPQKGCDDALFADCRITLGFDDEENLISASSAASGSVTYGRSVDRRQVSAVTEQVEVADVGPSLNSSWNLAPDAWGRPTTVTSPSGGVWEIDYTNRLAAGGCAGCAGGRLVAKLEMPTGEHARFNWSIAGKLESITRHITGAGVGEVLAAVDAVYDKSGKVLSYGVRDMSTQTSFEYDAGGVLEKVSVPVSEGDVLDWTLGISKLGTVDDLLTPDGADWGFERDELRMQKSALEATSGRKTVFQRDLVGRITERKLGDDPAAPVWTFEYDAVGRLSKAKAPADVAQNDGAVIDWTPSGFLEGVVVDTTKTVLAVARDTYERLQTAGREVGGNFVYSPQYDTTGTVTALQASWTVGQSTIEMEDDYEYDGAGRLSRVKADFKIDQAIELDVTYGYDLADRLESMTLAGGQAVLFERDDAGRLANIDFVVSGVVKRRTVFRYGEASSWLSDIETGSPEGDDELANTDVLNLGYFYDYSGQIVRIEEDGGARVLGYDKGSRLQSSHDYDTWPGGAPGEQRLFTYDKLGQRQSTNFNGVAANYTWSEYGELQTVIAGGVTETLTFDDDGNLETVVDSVAGTELEFVYDAAGRVVEVSDGNIRQHYAYWPDERRARVETDEGDNGSIDDTTLYFSDGLMTHVIDEATGELERSYLFLPNGYTPVMMVTYDNNVVDKVYFYHNDHLSTPRAMTDETGTIVWQSKSAPFGELLETCDPACAIDDQPIRFPGQWDDAVSGAWYNWHRFYLPGHGMYARRDPIRRLDGGEYSYVGANPVSVADPWGLDGVWVYLWTSNTAVGHAALVTDDGRVVISSYPTVLGGNQIFSGEDWCDHDGYAPDVMYHIWNADEQAIKDWAGKWGDTGWWLWDHCVDKVLHALEAGGLGSIAEEMEPGLPWDAVQLLKDALEESGYTPQSHPIGKTECD